MAARRYARDDRSDVSSRHEVAADPRRIVSLVMTLAAGLIVTFSRPVLRKNSICAGSELWVPMAEVFEPQAEGRRSAKPGEMKHFRSHNARNSSVRCTSLRTNVPEEYRFLKSIDVFIQKLPNF